MEAFSQRLKRGAEQISQLSWAVRLVFEASGKLTWLWISFLVLRGALPITSVLLTREVVDSLVEATRAGGDASSLRGLLSCSLALGAVLLIGEALGAMEALIREKQTELVKQHIASSIHRISSSLDLSFYEAPEYYDALHRARYEAGHRPEQVVETGGRLVENLVSLVSMFCVLFVFNHWLPFILVFATLPAVLVIFGHVARQYEWRRIRTSDQRRLWYFDYALTSAEHAAELRMLGLGSLFSQSHGALSAVLRSEQLGLSRKKLAGEMLAGVFGLLSLGMCAAWMGYRAIHDEITLGELAALLAALRQGGQLLRTSLENAGEIFRSTLFLADLKSFLSLKPKVSSPPDPVPIPTGAPKIEIRALRFSYPGEQRPAVDGASVEIAAGEIAAIVGKNGAGKSTLIKLMARLHDPESGAVLWNGVDIRKFDMDKLRRSVSVLFQAPVAYACTAKENIGYGDREADFARIREAAERAGADGCIEALPLGFDTVLGKWFEGGAQLSAGEWQRVALARAFLRSSSVLLLDEPTSDMDSWAEAGWMERLRAVAKGKTVVLVTHRLTTAMRADRIYVMDRGEVVESGTHDELIGRNGPYAVSWLRGGGAGSEDAAG